MITRQYRPSWTRRLVLPAVTAVFIGYFAYHAVSGEYGLVGRAKFESKTKALQSELAELEHQKDQLETRVKLLRPDSLDQDMVEERARIELSVVNPNDVVIMDFASAAPQNN